jgi:hypothetical protein
LTDAIAAQPGLAAPGAPALASYLDTGAPPSRTRPGAQAAAVMP